MYLKEIGAVDFENDKITACLVAYFVSNKRGVDGSRDDLCCARVKKFLWTQEEVGLGLAQRINYDLMTSTDQYSSLRKKETKLYISQLAPR